MMEQSLITCLNHDYGIKTAKLTFLPIGADMNASVYKAETHDQSSYFVKLKRGHHQDMGASIIMLLQNGGIQEIIPPVLSVHGKPTHEVDGFTLIVFPFIEGQDGFGCDLTDNQWVTLGKIMRKIHAIDVPPSIQHKIRRENYSPKWREAVRLLCVDMESNTNTDEISLAFIAFMQSQSAMIHRLVERAEQLGNQIEDQSHPFALCHSDIHGGNVLIGDNGALYVVDWDDPMMAPKERDLMFIGGGVANTWNKLHEENFFYRGYGETEINKTILAYYRHERIVEDIALLGEQLLSTNLLDEQTRIQSYTHFLDQFEPQGVVEIAFKTDEDAFQK